MAGSEVAELRQRIDVEREGIRNAFTGFAQVAGHEHIRKRYHAPEKHYEALVALVGEQEADDIYADEYNRAMEQQPQHKPKKQGVRVRLIYRCGGTGRE